MHMNMYNVDYYLEFIDTYNFYFTRFDFCNKMLLSLKTLQLKEMPIKILLSFFLLNVMYL